MIKTCLSVLLVLLAAQQVPPPRPGFKSGVTVVEVDVVVTDKAGRLVRGLRTEDLYRVPLPQELTAGSYRVIVASTLGRTTVAREVAFSVLPRP